MSETRTRIGTANLNLPPVAICTWGGEQFGEFIEQTGYTGVELHPVRSRLTAEVLLGGKATDLVTSLHQSYRGEGLGTLIQTVIKALGEHEWSQAFETAGLAAFPLTERSLKYLHAAARHASPRELDAVLYPGHADPHDESLFRSRLWQPKQDIVRQWGAWRSTTGATMAAMEAYMAQLGYDGVCIDTHHWTSSGMQPWQEALPVLAERKLIREVHFCPARPDAGGSIEQLRSLLTDSSQPVEALSMVEHAVREQPSAHVVVELPHAAIAELGYADYTGVHKHIVDRLTAVTV